MIEIKPADRDDYYTQVKTLINKIQNINLNSNLVENNSSYQLLLTIRQHYEYHKWVQDASKSAEEFMYYLISQLNTYYLFIEKYRDTRAVLIAKYLVAIALRDTNIDAWRNILKNIINNYPNTFEADFFHYLLTTEFKDSIRAIGKLLIWAKKFDEDNNLYIRTWKSILLRSERELFYPKVLLYLASEYRDAGYIDKAIEIYKEIIDKYPNTKSANDAQDSVNALTDSGW